MQFNIQKSISVIHHTSRLKKSHIVLSIDTKKGFEKIQHLFMIKTLSKLGIEVNFFKLVKNIVKTYK